MKTKAEANYKNSSNTNQCKDCFRYKPTIMHCTMVEGNIHPCGTCDIFLRARWM